MFPHYFERQRTDGVDHTVYVGASLVENGAFDELYPEPPTLAADGDVRDHPTDQAIRPELKVSLATTHLVLAHHAAVDPLPLDERRFDVEGRTTSATR